MSIITRLSLPIAGGLAIGLLFALGALAAASIYGILNRDEIEASVRYRGP